MCGNNLQNPEHLKQALGKYVAELIPSGVCVGLGTGSTARYAILELGKRLKTGKVCNLVAVATSYESTLLAQELGIPLIPLELCEKIDYAFDGADEIAPDFSLIKGGGGAHTREKIIDKLAENFYVIADSSKLVTCLGEKFPVPVEVLPCAVSLVLKELRNLGKASVRMSQGGKVGPVVTDNGNLIIDFSPHSRLSEPAVWEQRLNNIPGVVENGIFTNCVTKVFVAEFVGSEIVIRDLKRNENFASVV